MHESSNADYDVDLFVIGAGSGGLASAKRAASYGARVAIAERDRVGGTCVIRGCVPKKLMVYAAELGAALDDARGYGWQAGKTRFDWEYMVRRRNEAVARLERLHEQHLERAGVELLRGQARLAGPQLVEIDGRRVRARYILIATGSAPILPHIEGIEYAMTSDGFFELAEAPARVAIVGGGYIAVEFASILSGLGIDVTLLIRRELPLRGFDEDLRSELLAALEVAGVDVRTKTRVERIERRDGGVLLHTAGPDGETAHHADRALVYAVGRAPRSAGLGLEEAGVQCGPRGEIVIDDDLATSCPTVFAVGDVTGRFPLTPVAVQAGRLWADRTFGGKDVQMDWSGIPTAVFSEPPIGTVGLTEAEAVEQYGRDRIDVFRSRFTPLAYTLTERSVPTLIKMIVDREDGRVLGCHMIGRDAPEIIQGMAIAMKAGARKSDFDATVGIHPSSAEEFVTLTAG
ncbi:MAG: glutathione-disulfide reductase [Deltaproteobacteria bacterium]|nr:MAG: glutathione-disulfide reductase [Deltaproteobacteria bacterium]